jgi:hypothetical protein
MSNRPVGGIEIGQDGKDPLVIGLSVLGRTGPACRPIDQVNPKIVFKIGDVFADG